MPTGKSIHKDTNTKTEKQWIKEGRILKADAKGERLYTNGFCQISAIYYSIEETYQATKEEIGVIREPELAKKREYAKKRREFLKAGKFREMKLSKAHEMPGIPCDNPSKVVVFDTETTGLNWWEDEILQLAIMDGDGNILLNTYIKPYLKKSWSSAEKMREFAPIFGEWNEYYKNYKWQKLGTCAAYYNFEFKEHDALEDVKATLHCWKCMIKERM